MARIHEEGGWVKAVKCGRIRRGRCDRERHTRKKEKANRVEEQRSQRRGRRRRETDLFVDYCVTEEAPLKSLKEIWT